MKIPSLHSAETMLNEGERSNPGPWVDHSRFVAQAAQIIAEKLPGLEPQPAYILGLLHDIGRRAGVHDMRHILDGYHYLNNQGFSDAARICLTHSYAVQDARAYAGIWDGNTQEFQFVQDYLHSITYNRYDCLIQLCDALSLPTGFCLIEKRLMDVALRRGVNEFSVLRWQAYFKIQREFETLLGCSIYTLLPGVVENTFSVL